MDLPFNKNGGKQEENQFLQAFLCFSKFPQNFNFQLLSYCCCDFSVIFMIMIYSQRRHR